MTASINFFFTLSEGKSTNNFISANFNSTKLGFSISKGYQVSKPKKNNNNNNNKKEKKKKENNLICYAFVTPKRLIGKKKKGKTKKKSTLRIS